MSSRIQSHLAARPRSWGVAVACALLVSLAPTAGVAAANGPEAITIESSAARVTYGDDLTVTGTVSPRREGRTVKLTYRPPGGDYETIDEDTTDDDGDYRFKLAPEHSGNLKAVAVDPSGGDDVKSERVGVDVDATITARAKEHSLRTEPVTIHGRVRPGDRGRRVFIQQRRRGDWVSVEKTTTGADGAYAARFRAGIGSYRLRARFRGDDLNGRASREVDHRVNIYRSKTASYYGPGFYGNRTACGQTLRRSTIGVAHKSLPCGTRVRFYYRGRTLTVPVIDRGPFVGGREWDLTEAARDELRFPSLGEIWSTR